MDFDYTSSTRSLITRVETFMDNYIYPAEQAYTDWMDDPGNRWNQWPGMATLKRKAQSQGLWNLFLPREYGKFSPGLSNLEYAPLAEIFGRVPWSSEVFNCSAPDTGNMEVLAKYGSAQQQEQWLKPLLAGEIRSAYVMTEPQVASSDAANIECTIVRDGDRYVINGRKWWISGVRNPACKLLIVMGKTHATAARHRQHSTILVPRDTPGVSIVRDLKLLGAMNPPGSEVEMTFDNVRVPVENMILGEGRGFEIAQGRLGPGRIHHCMRSIGQAQRALEIMARRVDTRVAFGRKLADQSSIRQDIAKSFCEVEMARLLTLKAADRMDKVGNKAARDLIAAIKIVAPSMAHRVIDRAIQSHGAMGLSGDTPLAEFLSINRYVRIADGPDEVHMSQLGKLKIAEYATTDPVADEPAARLSG